MEKVNNDIDFTQFNEDGFCAEYDGLSDEELSAEGFHEFHPEDFSLGIMDELRSQLKKHNLTILETWSGGDPGMGISVMVMALDEFNEKRK